MALQAQNWQAAGNAAVSALDFEDVRELIGRFNAALQDCDYSTARCIIAALFSLDRVDSDDFRAKEVQSADLGSCIFFKLVVYVGCVMLTVQSMRLLQPAIVGLVC